MGDVKSKDKLKPMKEYTPVKDFQFLDPLEEDSNNGLCLNGIYVPEEVLENILIHIPPKHLLYLTLVCKKWNNIIKSDSFWKNVFNMHQPNKTQLLPWYIYYSYLNTNNFENLLKNGNGQEKFKHWKIVKNYGDQFVIEKKPQGSDPLPANVPEFYGHESCFATSFYECNKIQEIPLKDKRLIRYIITKFHVPIYASEWTAGRFDCGCEYHLKFTGFGETNNDLAKEHVDLGMHDITEEDNFDASEEGRSPHFEKAEKVTVRQWEGNKWEKVEIIISENYPADLAMLVFEHQGRDTQFWKGHYGSKMAGGVVKFLIEGIEPRN
ncbi:unnamed protein product [Phaedon cochleariae]|uniref:F-box protein n=1 Tax=Phaedon cochleariae TaxID=80249 RepID=A0A9P0DV91_PHACE|nr:unnamed protein product [Phaedon cochleariae]